MKKTAILITAICVSALMYVSCTSSDDVANQADTTTVSASLVVDAINEMDIKTSFAATNSNPAAKPSEVLPGTCAVITTPAETTYPRVYTVDYGTGCTINQITRKGKLKITLSGPIITTGSKMTIERVDYYVGPYKIEGTIEYTNTTAVATVPQWTRKITNGKLTDNSGRVFTSSGTSTVKQTEGVSTPYVLDDNVYEMPEGTLTIVSDKGTLTLTVQEALVKKYSCEYISKGKLKIEGGALNGVIDYGSNTCDARYTYTHQSGATYNLEM